MFWVRGLGLGFRVQGVGCASSGLVVQRHGFGVLRHALSAYGAG